MNDRAGNEATNGVGHSAIEDATALKRLAGGDQLALSTLYRRYGPNVYGLALRLVKDSGEAEEITQDVFSKVWKNADSYRSERGSVGTWIMRIARNRAIDALRSRKADLLHVRRGLESPDGFASWSEPPDPVGDVAKDWERRRVREAVSSLPAEQREALSLAFFSGKTHVQISDILEQPIGTVKTRIRLAMKKLRAVLADTFPPPDDSSRGGAS